MKRCFRYQILLLAGLALSSCQEEAEEAPAPAASAPAKVETAEVKTDLFADEVEALGTVRALEAIELSANVTERVEEIFFEDGQEVKKGDLLAKLSTDEEQAMLAAARANLEEQEREIKRLTELAEEGAVSQVRLQEYMTQRDIALQRVEEVQAQIGDRNIAAPFDGVLGFRQISLGALVGPGDVIATLDILDPVKLDFTVPETFLSDLRTGMEITAYTEAYPGEGFKGEVTQIDTRVNPVTRSVTVRAELPNPGLKLRPGMLLTTRLVKNPTTSLTIPERALLSVQSEHFAFVVEKAAEGEGMVVKRAQVHIGRRKPGYVEITSGLEKGQKIVSDGLLGLRDGAPVEVVGQFSEPAAPFNPSESAL